MATFITDIGFVLSDSIKLLGFKITREGIKEDVFFDNLLSKLVSIINFWQRFQLSLKGRINIFKALFCLK
jgi:hypothetical protein